MRAVRAVLLTVIFGLLAGFGAAGAARAAGPAEVQMGAYVLRISNVSQKDGTFDVDMWVWFRWKDAALRPFESFEVANGRINSRSNAEISDDGGYFYTSVRVDATVFHEYDVRRFPLDNHVLSIEFEDENLDAAGLTYAADAGIGLDPGLKVDGWAATLLPAQVALHHYPTNYGLRSSGTGGSDYSRLILQVSLERTSMGALFKGFWISALSVMLGLLAFRVKPTDLDARFGLGVGSIFAASANAFVITDSLPQTTFVTLAEQINYIAIGTIFLSVFMSIASLRLCYAGREAASEKLDVWGLALIALGYLAANVLILIVPL
jgi:hypothetical protein